ncbi:BnaC01g21330D [Brassica napus]|uniref:BnaC01g21330D protein n=1 Tax=Brassica napus TaxID=3708 RepID=A0A078HD24_BRANA|nr:BnaC01g21330D [Brassica napus]
MVRNTCLFFCYPGAVSNTPTYILMSETTMELNMEASAENKNTPINLDQNTYWNLVDHARSLRERDLLSLPPQEMDRRVYRREEEKLYKILKKFQE